VQDVIENTKGTVYVERRDTTEESDEEPKKCIDSLCFHIENKYANIEAVFLNNCKISDDGASQIFSTLLASSN
jgi:hypothetical protein